MGDILAMCCREWRRTRASVYGPVWFVSTDGATVFRSACYEHFTTRKFDGPLGALLSGLDGLNLSCGEDYIIHWHCPDTKHIFKREQSLVHHEHGTVLLTSA